MTKIEMTMLGQLKFQEQELYPMNKWILCCIQMPPYGTEVIVISLDDDGIPCNTIVWFAKYDDGKFFIFDLEDVYELAFKPICWMPKPTSPFLGAQYLVH